MPIGTQSHLHLGSITYSHKWIDNNVISKSSSGWFKLTRTSVFSLSLSLPTRYISWKPTLIKRGKSICEVISLRNGKFEATSED